MIGKKLKVHEILALTDKSKTTKDSDTLTTTTIRISNKRRGHNKNVIKDLIQVGSNIGPMKNVKDFYASTTSETNETSTDNNRYKKKKQSKNQPNKSMSIRTSSLNL